ncbi:MAG TPA: PIN domain-containing protein [Verrucomicrobiae bacterium]|nr:PIN domain-containing protein [Verrucomicrobiae bacterium]
MSKSQDTPSIVVPDSNALFPKSPTKIASERFTNTWIECLKLGKLRLVLPEVVRGERLYRLVSTVRCSLENAAKNFETIAAVSASEMTPLPGIEMLRSAIEKRFDQWMESMGAEIIPVPCDKINWQRVVNDAIWRNSPFTQAGDDTDSEKGFRDCLIVETLDELIRSNVGSQVVFITKDRLLRDATIARFQPEALAAYEDLNAFLSYLKLTHEQVEKARKESVQVILQKAPSVFYSSDSPNCVYTKFAIGNRILQEFSSHLSAKPPSHIEGSQTEVETLMPASDEKIFIDSTQYEPVTRSKVTWGWKTRLRFARVFKKRRAPSSTPVSERTDLWRELVDALGVDDMVRIAPFDVFWTARCSQSGDFSELKIRDVKPQQQTWELGFNKFKYGFS